ncbi:MAG: divergent polysaccharide deacetylase family protein [Alphaproteobacteria bacterium]|nr:divergent polysaccharide deacetylase family protein [Alphaproteobacteria bacterium]NCQ67668.1 divergent polysaccharide deacetylase family protein [Alphaproteobacteria bacterium]NCT07570.1 divergent polysaccharide deacetylase family protein [Alphaproteobacteria bacterium]
MRFISLPRISKLWVAAIVAALLSVGVIVVVMSPPIEKKPSASVVLLDHVPADPKVRTEDQQVKDVAQKEAEEMPRVETEKSEITTPLDRVTELSDLTEEEVTPRDPLVLPKESPENTDIVQVDKAVLEQAPEEPSKSLPYAHPECLEEKEEGALLPVISPGGLRPFDVYQSDIISDMGKTPLTLVFSELGSSPKVFEFLKSSFPKSVTCAFIANRDLSQQLNNEARELGYETLLMLPMEPVAYPKSDPGPETLLTNLPRAENLKRFEKSLSQFTGYIGVTPYMGSRFARVKRDFEPLLKEVERRGLFYFEPRLIRSVALQLKPEKMLWAKGQYDIGQGLSRSKIRTILNQAKETLGQKKAVIITVQGDIVSFEEVKKWLPSVLEKDVALLPLSRVIQ